MRSFLSILISNYGKEHFIFIISTNLYGSLWFVVRPGVCGDQGFDTHLTYVAGVNKLAFPPVLAGEKLL